MRGVTIGSISRSAPPFMAEPVGNHTLIPGAVILDGDAFEGVVPAGTAIGRTNAERAAHAPFGPAAESDDEIFVIAYDVTIGKDGNEGVAVKPGTVLYEDRLPEGAAAAVAGVYTLILSASAE